MYIRLVWRSLRPGRWDDFERYYRNSYMTGLQDVRGQQLPSLFRSMDNPDEGIALSLWDSLEGMLEFERNPIRQELARGLEEFYGPMAYPRGDYWVKHFEIVSTRPLTEFSSGFLRLVGGKLRPGGWQEYQGHYLQSVEGDSGENPGLLGRQLLRGTDDPDEAVSLSVWNSLDDMRNYETGESRQSLAREVEHLYTGQYWVKHFEVRSSDC